MSAIEDLPLARIGGEEWRDYAACKGHLHLFFAKKSERPEARARREAKARTFCDVCPVRLPCRQYAREHRLYGFWGGESEEERHQAGFSLTAPIGVARSGGSDRD